MTPTPTDEMNFDAIDTLERYVHDHEYVPYAQSAIDKSRKERGGCSDEELVIRLAMGFMHDIIGKMDDDAHDAGKGNTS